jgi:hypothetical protein
VVLDIWVWFSSMKKLVRNYDQNLQLVLKTNSHVTSAKSANQIHRLGGENMLSTVVYLIFWTCSCAYLSVNL